jgi:hypothetical protein
MKLFLSIIVCFFLINGCAPTVRHMREPWMDTFGKVSNLLVIGKTSKNDIYKKFGIPSTKTFFSSGIEQWKYFYSRRWVYEQYRHLGTYGVMDKVVCFSFDPGGVLIEFSYEETPG